MDFKDEKEDFFDGPDIPESPKVEKTPALHPDDPKYWEQDESEFEHLKPGKKNVIWIWVAVAGIAIGFAIALYLRYFSPYVSEATQYGYVDSIENRGTIFHTYEGVLIPYKEFHDTTRVYREDFRFSTDARRGTQLRRMMYKNIPVRVEYRRYHATLPWRGDSRVYVVAVDTADPALILPPEFQR